MSAGIGIRLLSVALATMAGCWVGVLWPLAVLLLVGLCWRRGRGLCLLLALAYGYGALQLQWALAERLPVSLEGREITVTGHVVGVPATVTEFRFGQWRRRQTLTVMIKGPPSWPGYHRLRVNAYGLPLRVFAGDRLKLTVKLKASRGVYNQTGSDLARRDLARGLAGRGTVRQWERLQEGDGLPRWRERLAMGIADRVAVSPDGRAILPALVVGDRSRIDSALWQGFQATGGAHLLAISGLHVAIVAGWFWGLGRWLLAPLAQTLVPWLARFGCQQLAWGPALVAACCYAALAGFSLPTLRAVIMLVVLALARCLRVPVPLWQSLVLALLAVLLLMPLSALSESLWLSFGAVAFIAALMTGHGSRRLLVLLPVMMTLAGVLLFEQWTVTAPLANLVLVPLYSLLVIPLALLGALLRVEELLLAAATGVEASVLFMAALADISTGLPLPLPAWPAGLAALTGLLLCLLPGLPFPRRLLPLFLLPWLVQSPPPLNKGEWELTAFDVGQGLALAVRTRSHLLLYDTGASWPGGSMARRIIVPWLRRQGLDPNRVIISHGDNDHAGGLRDLHTQSPVLSGEAGRVAGSMPCRAGQQWQWDGVDFRMLWPRDGAVEGNDASCVLAVSGPFGGALLPGDISRHSEYRLLGSLPKADLLVLAHHGSQSSTTAALLRQIRPAYALASAGYRNRFGHPHPAVLERLRHAGITVLRTDRDGMIVFRMGAADNVPLITKWRQSHARPWHRPAGWRFW
ncbi:MAG: DNA internalization-related competence protein ComEC/Rec2 [Pseudomonadales bacterium]|nr:DNA internalization-related competence protein ComEC/Rec2 [Pseudomonadales bacterium]